MVQCTPALLAVLRQRYEQTRQSVRSIAYDFGLTERTFRRIASNEGWVRLPPLVRDLEPSMRLAEEARALEREMFGRNFD